jgi:hypothetical protein
MLLVRALLGFNKFVPFGGNQRFRVGPLMDSAKFNRDVGFVLGANPAIRWLLKLE